MNDTVVNILLHKHMQKQDFTEVSIVKDDNFTYKVRHTHYYGCVCMYFIMIRKGKSDISKGVVAQNEITWL
jgi:hypothetical protein